MKAGYLEARGIKQKQGSWTEGNFRGIGKPNTVAQNFQMPENVTELRKFVQVKWRRSIGVTNVKVKQTNKQQTNNKHTTLR